MSGVVSSKLKSISFLFLGLCSEAQFVNFISRNNASDTSYGTHYDSLQRGGLMVLWDTISRNKLSYALRKTQMVVLTQKDSLWWQWSGSAWNRIAKSGWDSSYNRAKFDTTTRILKLYRVRGDSTSIVIPVGASGSGATSFSYSVVGNTVTETWNNAATASFDKSDSRIAGSDITNWNGKIDSVRAKIIFFTQGGNTFAANAILS